MVAGRFDKCSEGAQMRIRFAHAAAEKAGAKDIDTFLVAYLAESAEALVTFASPGFARAAPPGIKETKFVQPE